VGLDSLLAPDRSCDPSSNFFAREVQESAAFVLDPAVRVAFLGGVRGADLAAANYRQFDFCRPVVREALIAKCIPQNIARWQSNRRNEMVFE
jgi:hypothetical protein